MIYKNVLIKEILKIFSSTFQLIAKYQYERSVTQKDTIEDISKSHQYIQKNSLMVKESNGVQIFVSNS